MRRAWVVGLLLGLSLATAGADDEQVVEFNRDVRPILSENCFACHGPDAAERKAGLRLDEEAAAFAALENGNHAIVKGDPDASELVFRVEVDDPDLIMPPPQTGKSLTPREVATLRRWVDAGAAWEPHWSFAPIKRPEAPKSTGAGPIDAFLAAALESKGLEPVGLADRRTLIRRLSLDLIGLPPTPEEVEAFVADESADAYERLVDRLLASPRFGERMSVVWLDLVRYADSVGYHGDQPISVSPFRDYVIGAFNANLPFDQFTIEQIAGDRLPEPTLEQRVASGYNRLGMMSGEGGIQDKEYRAKYLAERVRNVSGTWLGVTIGCAECHDHKYDPFSTRDFYRLGAFFSDFREKGYYEGGDYGPFLPVPEPEQAARMAMLDGRIEEARQALNQSTPELIAAQRDWEREVAPSIAWKPLAPLEVKSVNGTSLAVLEDGSVLASGPVPATDTYTVVTRAPLEGVSALRIEAIPDASLPAAGPGLAGNGNFVLTELRLALQRGPETTPQPIVLENASATFEQTRHAEGFPEKAYAASQSIDGATDDPKGWAVLGEIGLENAAVFETAIDLTAGPEALLTFELVQNHPGVAHALGRFRISVATDARPIKAPGAGLPRPVREALAIAAEARTPEQAEALSAHYRTIAPLLAPERERLAALEKERAGVDAGIVRTVAMEPAEPRTIRILPRGNWMDDSGEVVEPGVPAVFPQPTASEGERLDRMDLARWLVSPENPLTSRALVNRLWKLYFGTGLSSKLDDLGSQGEWPSHPELLDDLAGRLIDDGWDVKKLIREIVASEAYRRSSVPTSEQVERDPTNRLLARQSRFRLDAELVRDTALALSGLLAERIGGPSVRPFQPPGYWSFLNFPRREWENDRGPSVYHRGLYIHWQRQYLYPSLLAFDAPSREECTAERVRSNTPLQALVLLNDPAYVEAARAFAERVLRGAGDDDSRIDRAFRLALARPARDEERAILADLVARHRESYGSDPEAARKLLEVGDRTAPGDLDPAELAAWTDAARAILNLHATITRN